MAVENRGKENRTGTTGAKKQGDEFRRNSDENANTTRVSRLNGAHQVRPGDRPKEKQQQKKNRGDFHEQRSAILRKRIRGLWEDPGAFSLAKPRAK